MDRKQFLKTCGFGCLVGIASVTLLQSCSASQVVSKQIVGDDLIVPITDFEVKTSDTTGYKKYLIVQNELLTHPICIYRFSATEYSALYMACTHQRAELQVYGDKLQCAAHGSEFSNRGLVESGPATADLRKFPVTIENSVLKISLK
ncbi:Rieske (2Fe-2S) protein [Flavobacterium soli]|uniref:Rieske (2Fe-2S) protein n=1 Tax=Flavobacterium soli TaxID=344881 RepID=UPI000413813A|nr:Rieske (2Fe-2S) protein [Flavobacterium soli]